MSLSDETPPAPRPMVSVVMPSLNQAAFLDAAIGSVLDQSWQRLELIVADGGSTDGSLDILAARAAVDPRLRWRSEPDGGPAQALNRALARCRGTILGWLNSDDLYTAGAVERAVAALTAAPTLIMVYGHCQHIDGDGRVIDRYPTKPPTSPLREFAKGCFIAQPTVFFRHTMYALLGPLDTSLGAAFDFEYWLRAFRAFPGRIGWIDAMQAQSRLHDACITLRLRCQVALEGMRVLARHLGRAPRHWLLTYAAELLAENPPVLTGDALKNHLADTVAQARHLLDAADACLLDQELAGMLLAAAQGTGSPSKRSACS
ncbi:glycosyltransferase family 2 protein [Solidesulfovibrio sp.]